MEKIKPYTVRTLIGFVLFIVWFSFDNANPCISRSLLGFKYNSGSYYLDFFSIGLVSLIGFLIFFFSPIGKKLLKEKFSFKSELKILLIYFFIFIIPFSCSCVHTEISADEIVKNDLFNESTVYKFDEIKAVKCNLYNIRGTYQIEYDITLDGDLIVIHGTNDPKTWQTMKNVDEFVRANNIPKTVNLETELDDIKALSGVRKFLNEPEGVYENIKDAEYLLEQN